MDAVITPDDLTLAHVEALEDEGFDPNVPSDYILGKLCALWKVSGGKDYIATRDICREINARADARARIDAEGRSHETAAGALCRGPEGFCLTCGVEMTVCNVCHGIGYHRERCPTMPESFDYARCEALRRLGITGELFAACNCVLYGSDAERAAARELLACNAARIADLETTPTCKL